MPEKLNIGDVLICKAEQTNPYHGSFMGYDRTWALDLFREGNLPTHLKAWYAPYWGGARVLTDPSEVEWHRDYYESEEYKFVHAEDIRKFERWKAARSAPGLSDTNYDNRKERNDKTM